MDALTMLGALGIPSAIMGVGVWFIKRSIDKIDKREAARQQNEILLIRSVGASIALGEAVAMAVKNGKSNGETETALEYARAIKHEQKDFLIRQGVENLF